QRLPAAARFAFNPLDRQVAGVEHQLGRRFVLPRKRVGGGAGEGAAVEIQRKVQRHVVDDDLVRLSVGMLVAGGRGHGGLRALGGRGGGLGGRLALAAGDQQGQQREGKQRGRAAERVRGKTHGRASPRGNIGPASLVE